MKENCRFRFALLLILSMYFIGCCDFGQINRIEEEVFVYTIIFSMQSGFTGEPFIVKINGVEVYKNENVQTKLLLGHAGSFEIKVKEKSVTIDLCLPARKLTETFEIELNEALYLGVSVLDNKIFYRTSTQPFTYL